MHQRTYIAPILLLFGVLYYRISLATPVLRPSDSLHSPLSQFTSAQNLSVPEETPVGTQIADLSSVLSHVLPRDRQASGDREASAGTLSLTLLQGSPYVALDARGALVVAGRIDREDSALCPQPVHQPAPPKKKAATATECTLQVSVLVQTHQSNAGQSQSGSSRPAAVSFSIAVLDVDDNAPQFPLPHLRTSLHENTPVGSLVLRVPVARDADASSEHWTPVEYRLVGRDAHFFTFVQNASSDSLELIVAQAIDREQLPNATLTLSIMAIPRSKQRLDLPNQSAVSILNVSVTVLDVNEFDPEFVGIPDEPIHLSENAETGTEVWRVVARDADAEGGPLEYRLAAHASDPVRRAFRLESASGRLLVARSQELDFERTWEFVVPIEAIDASSAGADGNTDNTANFQSRGISPVRPSRRTVAATLRVVLDNVNDNPPTVTISIPSSIRVSSSLRESFSKPSGHTLEISESAPIGTFLAAVTVSDLDESEGAGIVCDLISDTNARQNFQLEFLEEGQIFYNPYYYLCLNIIIKLF